MVAWKIKLVGTEQSSNWDVLKSSRYLGLPAFAPFTMEEMALNGAAYAKLRSVVPHTLLRKMESAPEKIDWVHVIKKYVFDKSPVLRLGCLHQMADFFAKLIVTPVDHLHGIQWKRTDKFLIVEPCQEDAAVGAVTHAWVAAQRVFGVGRQQPQLLDETVSLQLVHIPPVQPTVNNSFMEDIPAYKSRQEAMVGFQEVVKVSGGNGLYCLTPDGWQSLCHHHLLGVDECDNHFTALAQTDPETLFNNVVINNADGVTLEHKRNDKLQCQWLAARNLFGDHWATNGPTAEPMEVTQEQVSVTVDPATPSTNANTSTEPPSSTAEEDTLSQSHGGSVPGTVVTTTTDQANAQNRSNQILVELRAWLDHPEGQDRTHAAKSIWSNIENVFLDAATLYSDVIQLATEKPQMLADFLMVASPETKLLLEGAGDDFGPQLVIKAFSTAVFALVKPKLDEAKESYYHAAVGDSKEDPTQTTSQFQVITKKALKQILGLTHFFLSVHHERFPCFLKAIINVNNFTEGFKLPPPSYFVGEPANFGFPCKLPVTGWKALLSAFGVTPRGHVCRRKGIVKDVDVPDFLELMLEIEKIFKSKGPAHKLDQDDGHRVCQQVLGLHRVLWKISHKRSPQQYYDVLNCGVDMSKHPEDLPLDEFREHYQDKILDDDTDDGDYFDEEEPDGDVPVSGLYGFKSQATDSKPGGGRKKQQTKKQFGKNAKAACSEEAAKLVVTKWNEDGRPLDVQLASGRVMRDKYKLEATKGVTWPKLKATLIKLGTGDAPCVIGIENGLSPEFVEHNVQVMNKTPLVLDTHGDANTSSVGAFFYCKVCLADGSGKFMGPHMKLGKNNSLLSKLASEFQVEKQNMAGEIMNSFIDTGNQILYGVAKDKKTDPGPQIGSVNEGGLDAQFVVKNSGSDNDGMTAKAKLQEMGNKARAVQPPLIDGYIPQKDLRQAIQRVKGRGYDDSDLTGLEYFPRHNPNLTMDKVGPQATFSEHQDHQHVMSSDLVVKRNCTANGDLLPSQADFPVCTWISGTGSVPVEVQWSQHGKLCGSVYTDIGFMHIQLGGANDNWFKHGSKSVKAKVPATDAVDTEEDIGDPMFEKVDDFEVDDAMDLEEDEPMPDSVEQLPPPQQGEELRIDLHLKSWNQESREVRLPRGKSLKGLLNLLCMTQIIKGTGDIENEQWRPEKAPQGMTFDGFAFFSNINEPITYGEELTLFPRLPALNQNVPITDDCPELLLYLIFADEKGERYLYVQPTEDEPTNDNVPPPKEQGEMSIDDGMEETFDTNTRHIETFRMTACPHCDPASYIDGIHYDALVGLDNSSKRPFNKYNRISTFSNKLRTIAEVEETTITDGTEDPEHMAKYQTTKEAPAKQPQPPKFLHLDETLLELKLNEDVDGVKKVERPPPTVGLNDKTRRKTVNHHAVVHHALSNNVIFEVVDINGEPIKDQPIFLLDGQLAEPGKRYPISKLPFKITNRSMTVVHPEYGCVFLIVHAYKNDPRTFKLAHQVATMWQELDLSLQENRAKFQNACQALEAFGGLVLNGFGGSAQKSDTHALTAKTIQLNDPTYRIGDYQRSDNRETTLFMQAFDDKRPVAVFLVESKWAPSQPDHLQHPFQSEATNKQQNVVAGGDDSLPVDDGGEQPMPDRTDELQEGGDDDSIIDIGDGEGENSDMGDELGVDPVESDVGEDLDVEQDLSKGEMTFLGYFTGDFTAKRKFTMAQIEDIYKDMPNYFKAECWNISHMQYEVHRFTMLPFFTAEELLQQWQAKDRRAKDGGTPQPYLKVTVCDEDCRPLAVPYNELADYLSAKHRNNVAFWTREGVSLLKDPKVGIPRLKIEHIHEFVFEHMLQHPEDFVKWFESVRDDNVMGQGLVDKTEFRFLFDSTQAVAIAANVSAAGAYRQKRKHIFFADKEGRIVEDGVRKYCGPLVQEESDLLPDPLRITPLPNPNQDLDVNVQLLAQNHREYLEVFFEPTGPQDERPAEHPAIVKRGLDGHPLSYENLDLSFPEHCDILSELIFMAVVWRYTGNYMLQKGWSHPANGHKNIFLPTMDMAAEYTRFLEGCLIKSVPRKATTPKKKKGKNNKNFGKKPSGKRGGRRNKPNDNTVHYWKYTHLQSTQHQKTLPEFTSRTMFLRFVEALGASQVGFQRVRDYIKDKGRKGECLAREPLTRLMVQCMSNCGNLQMHENLQFLANKALLDVQCVLIDYISDMTLDCIHLGWGSRQGLDCIKLLQSGTFKQRFAMFHDSFHKELLSADQKLLHALGYERKYRDEEKKDPYIVSLFSGRLYSMNDTEHILCKIWLAVIHAHQSRNVSAVKAQHNNHTWPQPIELPCELHLQAIMDIVWDSFKLIRDSHPYPEKVGFFFASGKHKTSKNASGKNKKRKLQKN